MSSDAELLLMQAPSGVPRSTFFDVVTDPLLPPTKTSDQLAHFPEQVYDLSPESHLVRFIKVLLGDVGTGQLRKAYTYAHLSQFLLTTHYNDLDQLYASVFGLNRFLRERLGIDPYNEAATEAEWEAIDAADASYRNRIEAFSHAIAWAGTPTGMLIGSNAVLGAECRIYETYAFTDNADIYAPEDDPEHQTYGDLEDFTYGELDGMTYASLEATQVFQGRLPSGRNEFIVRPLRPISVEERYHLTKTLNRIKPAEALMTIDARQTEMHIAVPVSRVVASSTYWRVQPQVQVNPQFRDSYERFSDTEPVEQPRGAFSAYQGQIWSYNGDVLSTTSYVEDETGELIQDVNYARDVDEVTGEVVDYGPENALQDPQEILLGRYASDGVLTSPVAERGPR